MTPLGKGNSTGHLVRKARVLQKQRGKPFHPVPTQKFNIISNKEKNQAWKKYIM